MYNFYLYCITDSRDDMPVSEMGISGQKVGIYDYGRYGVLYSCLESDCVNREPENLKIHNNISLYAMNMGTVLPFRFGTIVKQMTDMDDVLKNMHIQPEVLFCRLKGKVEAGLKVFGKLEMPEIVKITSMPALDRLNAIERKSLPVYYLMNKVKTAYNTKAREELTIKLSGSIFAAFEQMVCDRLIIYGQKDGLLLNGAFLILKENFPEFKNRLLDIKKLFPYYSFIFSGPWPPYSFVNCRKEGENGE
jgi:hypothetical protein